MSVNDALVYIVDYDADVRDALSFLMKSVGLDVRSYASAKDFLAHYRPHAHCCLVLDIRMPHMSGIDLQHELKKRRISLPIIFLTGHGDNRISSPKRCKTVVRVPTWQNVWHCSATGKRRCFV